jgi:HAD superfamily hydrolase (TIGR01509 family)
MSIRAIIFDCNGLLCDDEPYHFQGLQRALSDESIPLDQKTYLDRYISFDDYGAVRQVLADSGRPAGGEVVDRIIGRKRGYYNELIDRDLRLFPGVTAFVQAAARRFATAIASGAIRSEIDRILSRAGIAGCFPVIVSAEDVQRCKPAPDSYRLALERLNKQAGYASSPLRPNECLALEDSRGGVASAREAGMRVVAVTNSHPAGELGHAHRVIATLEGVSPESLASAWD